MEKVHIVQRQRNVACSVVSSGNMRVARSRHEFNHVQIATWLAIHKTGFLKLNQRALMSQLIHALGHEMT